MRPTLSIVLFTTLSGAGYGLWFLLGMAISIGAWPPGRSTVLVPLALGLVLTSAGLLASLAHLGKPLRAWRALSQWRSSWLSREGVASLACVPVVVLLAICVDRAHLSTAIRLGFLLLAVLAAATVFCTSRIYSSLKTIRAWHNPRVLPLFALLALQTGGLCLWAVRSRHPAERIADWMWLVALALVIVAATWLQHAYWRALDRMPATSAGVATGLDRFGAVRSFEAPHTEENYLIREMGFAFARRRAALLRETTRTLLFFVPMLALGATALAPRAGSVVAALAASCALAGVFVQRWLFFAEARHVVMAYYGRE
ncbi:MAG TPA: DmsC/YnfH family molybdoenzyme membrane anchor subunit [Rhodanobacteraceae bacterium]|nr:DmsC/YnfH family molybdoenzyme membrane anchor subunit [Rhodanobacteraceae bacterium]